MASSGSSLISKHYDVFLSFRGADTRTTFIADLYKKLDDRAIKTFMDDSGLERGKSLDQLLTAIDQSRFVVVVLSPNFATSTWCLIELAHMVQCMNDGWVEILPIFYGVQPGDVGHQRGSFRRALEEHEKNNENGVREWRYALTIVAQISGWTTSANYRDESTLIHDIYLEIWNKVHPSFRYNVDSPWFDIERGRKQKKIQYLLCTENTSDVRFIGIYGESSRGNTTLAGLAFDEVSHSFEFLCFLENVGRDADEESLHYIQEQLMWQLTGRATRIPNDDPCEGVKVIKEFLKYKKVLIVLDGVDHSDQVYMVVGKKDWYSAGSRIIVTTTREERFRRKNGIDARSGNGFSDNENGELSRT